MNIQRKNSAHHFRMQSEHEQTLVHHFWYTHKTHVSNLDSKTNYFTLAGINENYCSLINLIKVSLKGAAL